MNNKYNMNNKSNLVKNYGIMDFTRRYIIISYK